MNKFIWKLLLVIGLGYSNLAVSCGAYIPERTNLLNVPESASCARLPDGEVWILSKNTQYFSTYPNVSRQQLMNIFRRKAEANARSDINRFVETSEMKEYFKEEYGLSSSEGYSEKTTRKLEVITRGLVRGIVVLKESVTDQGISIIVGVSPSSADVARAFSDVMNGDGGHSNISTETDYSVEKSCYENPMFKNDSSCP